MAHFHAANERVPVWRRNSEPRLGTACCYVFTNDDASQLPLYPIG